MVHDLQTDNKGFRYGSFTIAIFLLGKPEIGHDCSAIYISKQDSLVLKKQKTNKQ